MIYKIELNFDLASKNEKKKINFKILITFVTYKMQSHIKLLILVIF